MELNIIRHLIQQVIKENFELINEVRPGKDFDWYLNNLLTKVTPNIDLSEYPNTSIMSEVKKELNIKVKKAMTFSNEYTNFYIVKLGDFAIKSNTGSQQISFQKEGIENKNFSFPYMYIYNDTAMVLRFGSRFFDTDEELRKEATGFINDRKLNVFTKEEKGIILIDSSLDTINLIDVTDYSNVKQNIDSSPEKKLAKEKKDYRSGQKINHEKYGKGEIQSSKKIGVDEDGNNLYNVVVLFDLDDHQISLTRNPKLSDKEKMDIFRSEMKKNTKILRMKKKASAVTQN